MVVYDVDGNRLSDEKAKTLDENQFYPFRWLAFVSINDDILVIAGKSSSEWDDGPEVVNRFIDVPLAEVISMTFFDGDSENVYLYRMLPDMRWELVANTEVCC